MPCESITDNGTLEGFFFLHASDVARSEASSLLWNFYFVSNDFNHCSTKSLRFNLCNFSRANIQTFERLTMLPLREMGAEKRRGKREKEREKLKSDIFFRELIFDNTRYKNPGKAY